MSSPTCQEEYNYTRAYATNMVYSGGYRIYSTMDPDIQQSLEDSYANPDTFPALNNSEYPETAAIGHRAGRQRQGHDRRQRKDLQPPV